MQHSDIRARLADLSDDELVRRVSQGMLTPEAHALGLAEIQARGLPEPAIAARAPDEPDPAADTPYLGDWVLLARQLEPTEAHLLCGLLQACGIAAFAGDTELVQTNQLWSIALGGASVRVPASQLAEAQAIHAALGRGEFSLDDDAPV